MSTYAGASARASARAAIARAHERDAGIKTSGGSGTYRSRYAANSRCGTIRPLPSSLSRGRSPTSSPLPSSLPLPPAALPFSPQLPTRTRVVTPSGNWNRARRFIVGPTLSIPDILSRRSTLPKPRETRDSRRIIEPGRKNGQLCVTSDFTCQRVLFSRSHEKRISRVTRNCVFVGLR